MRIGAGEAHLALTLRPEDDLALLSQRHKNPLHMGIPGSDLDRPAPEGEPLVHPLQHGLGVQRLAEEPDSFYDLQQ
jgi:hypothetical protein